MLAVLLLTVFLTYSHALHSPFVFDDIPNIVENPHLRIHSISFQEIWDALFKSPAKHRPLANLTFAFNILLHETNVSAYRLVNFLIHVGNGLLLYVFLSITLNLEVNRSKVQAPAEIAFWATLIWFVHPLHVQSVTYVVQRMNSLSSFFFLLALICYLRARLSSSANRAWLFATAGIISFFMALASKEIAITLPFFVFLYEWFFFRDLDYSWIKDNSRRIVGCLIVVAIIAWSYLGLTRFPEFSKITKTGSSRWPRGS